MIDYSPIWRTMKARGMTTYTLIYRHNINPRTIHNLKHSKGITTATLEQLCSALRCTPNDIVRFVPDSDDLHNM